MIRKFIDNYKRVLSVTALALLLCLGSAPMVAAQVGKNTVCEGVGYVATGPNGTCEPGTTGQKPIETTIKNVVDILSFVVGVAAVIMVIIGGLRYILSGGDSGNVQAAKNTILYALVGIAIVILAQVIVNFVIGFFIK